MYIVLNSIGIYWNIVSLFIEFHIPFELVCLKFNINDNCFDYNNGTIFHGQKCIKCDLSNKINIGIHTFEQIVFIAFNTFFPPLDVHL